jgi:signal transduction histidine kinase/ActR/RegA family two-component response regulator
MLSIAFIAGLVATVWAAVIHGTRVELDREMSARSRENGNLARAMQEHSERVLLTVDRALQRIQRNWATDHLSSELLQQISEDTDLLGDELILLATSNAEGRITREAIAHNSPVDVRPSVFDDREYFTALRDADAGHIHITALARGRRIDRPLIVLSRRLARHDGHFAGVAIAVIDTTQLVEAYTQADLGPEGMVALARDDGQPIGLVINGKPATMPDHRLHKVLVEQGDERLRGQYRIHSHIDGVERLYSFQRFSRLPLIVTVGSSVESLEAALARRHREWFVLAGAFTLMLVAGGVALLQAWRRQITSAARDEARRQLLASVSHEIRTPMNGVLGMSELLLEEPLSLPQREMVRTVQQSATELLRLVDDILDFTRIEARRLRLDRVSWSPVELANDCIALLRPAAERKGLQFNRVVGLETPAHVWGDPHRVRQIVLNLGANAIKFTDRGTLSLHLSARHAGQGQCHLRFDIVDTGIGIEPRELEHMFEPFTQGDESPNRQSAGTGLGLSISRDLARLMGGDILARSRPGRGSRFRLMLPADVVPASVPEDKPPEPALPPDLSIRALVRRPLRVLVAEDNPVNQRVASAMLASLGCRVTLVGNGSEAVAASAEPVFDLVLMDCFMPVMDGLAATREIRRREWGSTRHLPIIALTASATPEERARCLDAGMDDYLAKPYRKSALAALLAQYLPDDEP